MIRLVMVNEDNIKYEMLCVSYHEPFVALLLVTPDWSQE